MKTKKNILYHVTKLGSHVGLIKPRMINIHGHDKPMHFIPLAETPEAALNVCFPDLNKKDWTKMSFQLWEIEFAARHGISNPKQLKQMFGVRHAIDLNLWATGRSIRMTKADKFMVINDPKNIDFIQSTEVIKGNELPELIGFKFEHINL